MLRTMAEWRLGLATRRARVFPDWHDMTRIVHSLADMFCTRMFAIRCGYEDVDDLDHLRSDLAFKLTSGYRTLGGHINSHQNCCSDE
jgi:hypothetical protein